MDLKETSLPGTTTLFVPVILIAAWFVYQWIRRRALLVAMINRLPGTKPNLLFGNLLELWVPRSELFAGITRLMDRFPDEPLATMWLGPTVPHVNLRKAEAVEVMLTSTENLDKSVIYDYLYSWLGHGLLTSPGFKWHARRKIINPSFHFKILDNFVEVFNEQALILSSKLECHADDGKPFKIDSLVSLCSLDIIFETAMQKKINAQRDSESSYVRAVHSALDIMIERVFQPWFRSDWLFAISRQGRQQAKNLKIMHGFTDKANKSSSHSEAASGGDVYGQKRRQAFIDTLLDYSDNGHVLSDDNIREEVNTFMFAGHDTTASSITWTIYLLGLNPSIQERVVNELQSVIGNSDRSLTSSDLRELKYLECVIKESLRLYPPVPIFSRILKEDMQIAGYTIPKGVTVATHAFLLHRDPKYFPDPEVFNPDRFLPENSSPRSPYAYVPFSAGPRNCIGQKFALMEEKTVLAHLLRHYRVTSVETRDAIKLDFGVILRSANGIWIKLEKRNDFK